MLKAVTKLLKEILGLVWITNKYVAQQLVNAIAVLVQKGNSFFHNFVFGSREIPGFISATSPTSKTTLYAMRENVLKRNFILEMNPRYILVEMMISKFSEFIEWIFQKKQKNDLDKLRELDSILKVQIDTSIFDVSENEFEDLKFRLEKLNSEIFDDIISLFFKISISNSKNQLFIKLKSNAKLNERIMEIILFAEYQNHKLSLDSRNIKNSLQHKLQSILNK